MANAVVPSASNSFNVNKSIVAQSNEGKSRLYVHNDEEVFPNYFENSAGLDKLGESEFNEIHFEYDFRIHRETIQAVTEVGSSLQSFVSMIVYHQHVWWNYGYKLTLEEDQCFSLFLKSLGPTAHPEKEVPRGAVGNNSPRNQKPPHASNVQVIVGVKNNGNFEIIVEGDFLEGPLGSGYICNNLISNTQLQRIVEANEFVILRVSMDIDKNYFNIEGLIEPIASELSIPITLEHKDLLEAVLRRERCSKSDFVITRGSGARNDASSYHVHKNIIKLRSFVLEGILREKYSLPSDQMLVVDTEDRIIFPHLADEDMKFLLTYLYTGEVILPEFNAFARVGRVLSLLIDREQLTNVFMQWQKLIVKKLLEIEKLGDDNCIIEESFKALLSVFSAPYGALPYAKRMALSLLADQLVKSNESLMEKYGANEKYENYHIGHFMESALKLKRFIASVKKSANPLQ